jgi:hypothetical protein
MKYYFIIAEWTRIFWPNAGGSSLTKDIIQILIDKHPLQHQLDVNERCERIEETGGYAKESIKVLNWQEISKEEYDHFNDEN